MQPPCIAVKKSFLLLLFSVAFINLFGQGGLPAIVMNNSTVSAGNCWLTDPDSLRGNYAFGNTTMIINITGGSQAGIYLDSFKLRGDNDYINIYDGNSTAAPLLASMRRSSVSAWSVKSTGNVITILFHAQNDLPVPGVGWRLGIRSISPIQGDTPTFLPIFQSLHLSGPGMIDMADFDNDGDKDLLVEGMVIENTSFDDSAFVFNRVIQPVGAWRAARMCSADFDGDGLKDIFITGEGNFTGIFKATTALFKNNGDQTFTRIIIPAFTDLGRGSCSVKDLNGDGRLDIAYTGSTDLTPGSCLFKIFLNNGSFSFTEVTNDLPGLLASSMDWFDYDSDGDQDLVLNGYNSLLGTISNLYKNSSNTTFTPVSMPPFFQTSAGAIKWADFNADGKMDIINTGVTTYGTTSGVIPDILINNGSDNFIRQITNLPTRGLTNLDTYDYDGDGDADLIYSGILPASGETDVAVYKNTGGGNFSVAHKRVGAQCLTTVKWIDLDGDNRRDIFVGGRDNYNPSYVLRNMGADSFKISSYPFTAYALGSNSTVLVEDLNNDGVPDYLFAGMIDDQDCVEGNTSTLTISLGWLKKPTISLKKLVDIRNTPGVTFTAGSFWRWGDVNNDGKPDIMVSKLSEPLRIFRNDGNGNFPLMYSGSINPAKVYEQCGIIDIDNDGTNELYVSPNKLYKWNGTGFTTLYEATGIGCEGGFLGTCDGWMDMADYNLDGFMDVMFIQNNFVYILRNNRTGMLVNDYPAYLFSLGVASEVREVRWMDYDSDGDPDLLALNGIFENTSWGGFRYRGKDYLDFGNVGFSDFNYDGKLDMVTINRTPPNLGPGHIYYNHQGSSFFQEITPPNFFKSYGGAYRVGVYVNDLDLDGDDDIIYATGGDCTYAGVYVNRYNETHRNLHLQRPNGGETYVVGGTLPIKWVGFNLGSTTKVEISTDGGSNYTLVTAAAPSTATGGQYNWTIAGLSPSNDCRVRVTDNASGLTADFSDKNFKIQLATALPVIIRSNDMRIFPNPTTGIFYCVAENIQGNPQVTMKVFDVNGSEMMTRKATISATTGIPVDISLFPNGYYFIQLQYKNILLTQKIAKIR